MTAAEQDCSSPGIAIDRIDDAGPSLMWTAAMRNSMILPPPTVVHRNGIIRQLLLLADMSSCEISEP